MVFFLCDIITKIMSDNHWLDTIDIRIKSIVIILCVDSEQVVQR